MIRKRTSFKPKLTSAAGAESTNSATAQTTTAPVTTSLAPNVDSHIEPETIKELQVPANTDSIVIVETPSINDVIQKAITELKGQRSEPIKLSSYAANKNIKLKDLLFFNPPMTREQKRHRKNISIKKQAEQLQPPEAVAPQPAVIEDNDQSLVPRVKMGADGNLVLDEESLVISRKNPLREQQPIIEDNDDIVGSTNYDSFRRRPANLGQTKWSETDTKKFYQALTLVGTDFSLMESLIFSGVRSRAELHKKFKREERLNKMKIDIALKNRISIGSEELNKLRESLFNQTETVA